MGTKGKVGYIWGRRIVGDILLGTDPNTNAPGRIFGPAVRLTGNDQYYDEVSPIQNYTIGSKVVVDERTYHYSQAVAAALLGGSTHRLLVSRDQILANNDRLTVAPAHVAGDIVLTIDVALGFAPGFLAFQGGVVALNELAGGWAEIWTAGNNEQWRRIIANTANALGNITITLDRPINLDVAIGSQVTIHPSIYRNASLPFVGGFNAAIGIPPVPVPINNYFWLQTYGPCFLDPNGPNWQLAVADDYDVYFHVNGTSWSFSAEYGAGAIAGDKSIQRVGHVMGSGAYGSGAIILELAS